MFRTVEATVVRPGAPVKDRLGNDAFGEPSRESVRVLVQEPSSEDMEAARPFGVELAYTLHFPKTFTASLEGCTVELPEPWANDGGYRVVGDPRPLMDANTPGRFDRKVKVVAAHG